ncbi:hypothetical protein SAMN05443637_10732 [Pseudonocardia thermophila]|uniref:Luciferase-like monooxygenase n=1 Tax=Pseudonocardia thermophila TaxID=1848 RepID=A0A1M6SY55_PSETH|nr:hypothetical protein [Pseudonocardia thermophila]SHK49672.1 hypothetical protein SAMN05443637_10732 [Pseudonocardia thermophila]
MTAPFYTARNHLGVELGADATTAQLRTAGRGFDYAVLPAVAAARIGPLVGEIGLVVRGPIPATPDPRWGWEPLGPLPAGPSHLPLFLHVFPGDPVDAVVHADAVRVTAPDLATAGAMRARVRAAARAGGLDPGVLPVLADLDVHITDKGRPAAPDRLSVTGSAADVARVIEAGVRLRAADGVTLRPRDPENDLRRLAAELIPLLAGRGLFRPGPPGPLRDRLALGAHPATVPTVESA